MIDGFENELFITQDGSFSFIAHRFGVSYHSKYGAVSESRHVFIQAGLYPSILNHTSLHILEIGFGTGLNALMTLQEANKHQFPIFYEGVEAYPITASAAHGLNYAECLGDPMLDPALQNMHEQAWGTSAAYSPFFSLYKRLAQFESIQAIEQFDLIYFDAFAPVAQPELWDLPFLTQMYTALKPKGVLVTYCAKGSVKRNLKSIGFEVEPLQGPPGKREMTRAIKK
jgi:tRNA U34 5-methylaminomethyl-2-thiouridine-forming methyltransferase MnmC